MSFPDIQVINVDPTTGLVTFGLQPKEITGISKLVQIVVLSLLNIPGQDALDPNIGGGLPTLVGSNVSPSDSTEVFAQVAQCVSKTETDVINAQIGLDEDPEELLQELQIVAISDGAEVDEVLVTIRVINEAGRTLDITV